MIIAFFGHKNISGIAALSKDVEKAIISNINLSEPLTFYCGGYGDFDNLCANVCRSIKEYIKCEIVFITPYLSENQQRKINDLINNKSYDCALYPPIENTPLKYAISKRNEWIANEADLIIAYVAHNYGGAYKSLLYAKRKKKKIINLAEINFK